MDTTLYAAYELIRLANNHKREVQVFDSDHQWVLERNPTFYPVEKYIRGLNPVSEYEVGFHIDKGWMRRIIMFPRLRSVLDKIIESGESFVLENMYIETP